MARSKVATKVIVTAPAPPADLPLSAVRVHVLRLPDGETTQDLPYDNDLSAEELAEALELYTRLVWRGGPDMRRGSGIPLHGYNKIRRCFGQHFRNGNEEPHEDEDAEAFFDVTLNYLAALVEMTQRPDEQRAERFRIELVPAGVILRAKGAV